MEGGTACSLAELHAYVGVVVIDCQVCTERLDELEPAWRARRRDFEATESETSVFVRPGIKARLTVASQPESRTGLRRSTM